MSIMSNGYDFIEYFDTNPEEVEESFELPDTRTATIMYKMTSGFDTYQMWSILDTDFEYVLPTEDIPIVKELIEYYTNEWQK
jgi:hypothetical protein